MAQIDFEALLNAQAKVLKLVASGRPLGICLDTICREIEGLLSDDGVKSSILILNDQSLVHGAAPSLPTAYCDAINGVQIGDNVGSCGTAAFTARPVYVDDIASSREWKDFADLALSFDLKACWSTPIISSNNAVLGTFAVYYDHVKKPEKHHLDLIEFFQSLCAVSIEKDQMLQREIELNSSLRASANKLQAFGTVMPDLAFVLDEEGTYVDVYGADDNLLYRDLQKIMGKKISDIFPEEETANFIKVIEESLRSGSIQKYEYMLTVPKGEVVFEARVAPVEHYDVNNPEKKHIIWLARDITDRKLNQLEIEKLAFFDPLTDLPNRRLLMDRLGETIKRVRRHQEVAALIFLDLDNFKAINDSIGHSGGDRVLKQVAKVLEDTLRDADTLARIGGDEFVILLESFEDTPDRMHDEAKRVCERIIKNLKVEFSISGKKFSVGASLGVSLIQGENITADAILGHADIAMYDAKKQGKGRLCFYGND